MLSRYLAVIMFICVPLLGAIGTAQDKAQPIEPMFEFKLKKPADSIAVSNEKGRTRFVITSESGIGDGTIRLTKGAWPDNISVRFVYAKGAGFTKLESIGLTTARLQVSASVHGAGEHKLPFWFVDAAGKFDRKAPAAGALTIHAKKENGALELDLPANLCVGSQEIKIGWIDFYRQ